MDNTFNKKAYPGKFLGYAYDYSIGESGVYRREDKIFSSTSGEIVIDNSYLPPRIMVKNELSEYLPRISDEVYCKVNKVTKNSVFVDIIGSKNKIFRTSISGIIKYECVKADFKDFDIFEFFVPGDIVLARVISIDQTNFIYLSTQDPQHGVIFARNSLSKELMMPVSFEKMMCLDTKIQETRKVAKPSFT